MRNKNQMTLIQTISNSRAIITERFGSKSSRSLQVTGAIGIANILIFMGGIATFFGIMMIYRIRKIEKGKNFGLVYRNIKKMMKKQRMVWKIKPVKYEEDETDERKLYVMLLENVKVEDFVNLQNEVREQFELELLKAATMPENRRNCND